jgi:hypothetical protein
VTVTWTGCGDKFGGKWIRSELDEIFGVIETAMEVNPGLESAGPQFEACIGSSIGIA